MVSNNRLLVVITTSDSRNELNTIGKRLVSERVAACAQISGPIVSHYVWQGRLEESEEWQLKIKTLESLYHKVEQRILELHSYELPQIIALPISRASQGFSEWIKSCVSA